uniref:NADH-ubiquinone oxidoreductase chain 6 n=1 Tax=Geotrichum candidum TaxID=1173061 RepID=A0A0A1I5X8_GEOCN|nr:NADH dehydrogenase subunit 6 [Geotrichum candidum]CDI44089.1 NADH dehydrogenase subunit 6 [Geotrichum candidum]
MLNQMMELMNTHNQYNNNLMMLLEYLSVMSALSVMFSSNAMVSMMYLMSLYMNVSMYLYFTGLGVMGLLYMLVYVGAMAMLFLFMLSLMNLKMSELSVTSNKQDMMFMLMMLMTLMYISNYVLNVESINDMMSLNNNDLIGESVEMYNVLNINWNDLSSYSELKIIGELLYTQYSMTMLMMGLMLLLAIMGVMIMTK